MSPSKFGWARSCRNFRNESGYLCYKGLSGGGPLIHEAQKQESLGNRNETELNYNKAFFLLEKLDRIDGLAYSEDIRKLMDLVQEKL